jgi:hypothetical protein
MAIISPPTIPPVIPIYDPMIGEDIKNTNREPRAITAAIISRYRGFILCFVVCDFDFLFAISFTGRY